MQLAASSAPIYAAAVVAALASGLLLISPLPAATFAITGALIGLCTIALLCKLRPMHYYIGLIVALNIVDGIYPGYPQAFTNELERFVTGNALTKGMPSPYEWTGVGLFAWTVIKKAMVPGGKWNQGFKMCVLVTGLFSVYSVWSVLFGLAQGGNMRVLYWQSHGMIQLIFWSVGSYLSCQSNEDALAFLDALIGSVLLKTVQNLYVYYGRQHGTLNGEEYLQSHLGSFFMAPVMLALVLRFFYPADGKRRYWLLFATACILNMWLANDRRSSMVGLLLSLLLGFPMVLSYVTKQHLYRLATIVTVIAVVLGASWNLSGPLGIPARAIQSLASHGGKSEGEGVAEYRDKENYNSYVGVSHSPLFGTGFGFPFVQYIDLWELHGLEINLTWITHNNVLMIWMDQGPCGIAAWCIFVAFGLAVMVRLFRLVTDRRLRIFAFVSFSILVQWETYVWTDQAFIMYPDMMLPACITGFCFKLMTFAVPHSRAELTGTQS